MPAPNPKGVYITNRIEELSKRSDVTPFEVKALQREIDKLMAVDAAEAYMLGGMLAAMVGNRVEAQTLHEKSLRLECDIVGLFNFGISMKKVNNLSLAKELFARAAELSPGDVEISSHRFQTMNFLLDYEDFERVAEEVLRAHPGMDLKEVAEYEDAQDIIDSSGRLGISRGELKRFGLHVEKTLLSFDLNASYFVQHTSTFDGAPHIYAEYHVDTNSADILFGVNELLVDSIVNDDSLENWDKVVISIVRRDPDQLDPDGCQHTAA